MVLLGSHHVGAVTQHHVPSLVHDLLSKVLHAEGSGDDQPQAVAPAQLHHALGLQGRVGGHDQRDLPPQDPAEDLLALVVVLFLLFAVLLGRPESLVQELVHGHAGLGALLGLEGPLDCGGVVALEGDAPGQEGVLGTLRAGVDEGGLSGQQGLGAGAESVGGDARPGKALVFQLSKVKGPLDVHLGH